MSVIFRVDVDNPYGHHTIFKKTLNFVSIKTPFSIRLNFIGYLKHLEQFLTFCNKNKITCKLFFRRCTIPKKNILKLIKDGNHEIGWHVESCKTVKNFKKEYNYMCKKLNKKIKIYSKHGSGIIHNNRKSPYKSGYYHYPDYNQNDLLEFGNKLGLKEFYGNYEDPSKCILEKYKNINYYSNMFWIKEEYRDTKKYTIEWLIKESKKKEIVLLIHPYNFYKCKQVNRDFKEFVNKIKKSEVDD